MLHGFNFSKLVLLSTLIFTCSNACNSHIFQYQVPITLSVRRTPNQADSDVICSRSCDQGKIRKRIESHSGLRKTRFFSKKTTHLFLFFWKKRVFVLFKKNTKIHFEFFSLHHAIVECFSAYFAGLWQVPSCPCQPRYEASAPLALVMCLLSLSAEAWSLCPFLPLLSPSCPCPLSSLPASVHGQKT